MKVLPNKQRLIFLTLDPLNPINIKLIERLEEDFSVCVITDHQLSDSYPCENRKYNYKQNFLDVFFLYFYKHIDSKQEKEFIKRNVYHKHTWLINFFFRIKSHLYLPSYSEICFFLYKNKKIEGDLIRDSDICLTDATLRHTISLNPLIVRASIITKKLVAYVTSWDNPQYSTINTFAQKYLTWNEENRQEMIGWHKINSDNIFIVGSMIHDYLIDNKSLNINKSPKEVNKKRLIVLYAAVFSGNDEIMVIEEVKFIIKISKEIKKKMPNFKLIFRTYPSLASSTLYDPLREFDWIDVYEYNNYITVSRLGNKPEKYNFNDKVDEKIRQFSSVDVFLSAGSTYTIEVAFSNTPIVHINAEVFRQAFKGSEYLDRLAIYGHLKHLSPVGFDMNVVGSVDKLIDSLCELDILRRSGYNEYLRSFAKPFPDSLSRDLITNSLKESF
jgi:hypothetical protein